MKTVTSIHLQHSIVSRLTTMNLVLLAAVGGIIIMVFYSFHNVKQGMNTVIDSNVSQVIKNAELGRELSGVFADANLLLGTFTEKDEFLQQEHDRLLMILHKQLETFSQNDETLPTALQQYEHSLRSILEQSAFVNGVLTEIRAMDQRMNQILDDVERKMVERLLEGHKIELETLSPLEGMVSWYRASLFRLIILADDMTNAYLGVVRVERNYLEETRHLLEELTENLGMLTLSGQYFVAFNQQLLEAAQRYVTQMTTLHQALTMFQTRLLELKAAQEQVNSAIAMLDANTAGATAAIQHNLDVTIRSALTAISVVAIGIGLILAGASYASRRLLRPIAQLAAAMNAMQSGDFDVVSLPTSRNEIGFLSQTFATMSRQLKENFETITRYNDSLRAEIVERKQVENALRESEVRYRSLFDEVPVGLFRTTPDGQILDANWAFVHLLGYSTREALFAHTSPEFYVNPQDREVWKNLMAQEGIVRDFEAQWWRDDGNIFWVKNTGRAIRNEQGEIVRYEGSLEDITERKRAEEELMRYRDHLEELVNARTTALQETLDDLQQTQSQLIQSEKMAALGKLIANVAHEINTPLGAIRASAGNILTAIDATFLHLPEVVRQLSPEQEAAFLALIHEACLPKPQLTSREDRQHRRALQHELEKAMISHADTLADTLVDMGVHGEIAALLPLFQHDRATLILRAAANIAVQRHNSDNILFAVERMSKIIFALKSYAHSDASGEATLASVTDGLEVVLTLYYNQLKHAIDVVKHYEEIPPIRCYPDELNQVWTNLIHNAIQAMQSKGRLEISVKTCEVSETSQVSGVLIEITDSGPGIPDAIKPRIFEPFFTTKPAGEGSGLGLDISRKIIEKHHGTIEFDSQPGRTTFRVWLPVS